MSSEKTKKTDEKANRAKALGLPTGKKAIKEALNRKRSSGAQRKLRKKSKLRSTARQRLEGGPAGFAASLSWRTKLLLAIVMAAGIGAMMWVSNLKREIVNRSMIFELASEGDSGGVSELLAEYPEAVHLLSQKKWTPLHTAAGRGHRAVVRVLIEHHADPDARNDDRRAPLHYAADGGYPTITRLLLNAGANVNPVDKYGRVPMHLAAAKGHLHVVQILAEARSQVKHADAFGITPLHLAAGNGHTDVVQFLCKRAVPLNAADREGLTPLHLAAENGRVKTIEALLAAGADPQIQEATGKTPHDLAVSAGHAAAAEVLKNKEPVQ